MTRSLCVACIFAWCLRSSDAVRCAVDNPQLISGGSDECATASRCFSLVQHFGETNSIASYFVGPSNAYLLQAQGCFKKSVAPIACSRRQCVLAVTEQDVKRKPFQFCCCTGDYCNAAENMVIRQLEPAAMRNQSVRTLARNQNKMEAFFERNRLDKDALWERWAREMYEQFKDEGEDEEAENESDFVTDADS